jgi:hypothetical protein
MLGFRFEPQDRAACSAVSAALTNRIDSFLK